MTTCFLAPDPIQGTFFIPGSNTPGNGVQVFFYENNTTTKSTVYKDPTASVAWSNPIVLDAGGNLPSGANVWLVQRVAYTVVYAPANDSDPPVSPYRTMNNIEGMNDIEHPYQVLVTSYTLTVPTVSVEFNNSIDWSRYAELEFKLLGIVCTIFTTEPFSIKLSSNGGATHSTNYAYNLLGSKLISPNSTFVVTSGVGFVTHGFIPLTDALGLGTTTSYFGIVKIPLPSVAEPTKMVVLSDLNYLDGSTNALTSMRGVGRCSAVSSGINGVSFAMASGNPISSGVFKVLGTLY